MKIVYCFIITLIISSSVNAGLSTILKGIEDLQLQQVKTIDEGGLQAQQISDDLQRIETEATIETIKIQSQELEEKTATLAEEAKAIEIARQELEEEKAELEESKKLFATGFYASSLAAAVAILGIFIRLPTIKLERELKRLEIATLQAGLDKENVQAHLTKS